MYVLLALCSAAQCNADLRHMLGLLGLQGQIKEDCQMTNHIRSLEEFASIHQMKINTDNDKHSRVSFC